MMHTVLCKQNYAHCTLHTECCTLYAAHCKLQVGRSDAARAALVWLRGDSYKLEPELKELEVLLCTTGEQQLL